MTIWQINGFSDGPHWDTAYIEAETAREAMDKLKAALRDGIDTVWESDSAPDESEWAISEAPRPLVFVLGSGCR